MTPSEERFARAGEVELCWQQFGRDPDPPLLMIMGLGAQMILWPDGFCERLADRGFRVIRFDNRDCGRSTVLEGAASPSIRGAMAGRLEDVPYTLSDLASDVTGLLDSLDIDRAHVVGASLGGMIAQTLAIERPERVLSLASIMSTTGDPAVGRPTEMGLQALMVQPPHDRDGYVRSVVQARATLGSPGFPSDEEERRRIAGLGFDRGYHPPGTVRQTVAIIASGDRTESLRQLELPVVVIHGAEDNLINVSGGRATAEAIPGARLVVIEGMGHDLPPGAWEQVAEAIVANAERAMQTTSAEG